MVVGLVNEIDNAFYTNCDACGHASLNVNYEKTTVTGKYIRETECPNCHMRTFRHVFDAEKQITALAVRVTEPQNINVDKHKFKLAADSPTRCNQCGQFAPVLMTSNDYSKFICASCAKIERKHVVRT